MILNNNVQIESVDFKYTIFERKDTKPYVSKSGLTVTTAVLAPFIYSYRTSTKQSNFKHRPIGLGVQGLADVFAFLDISFDSEKAKELNKQIFTVIYFASLKASNEISIARNENIKNSLEKIKNMNVSDIEKEIEII